MLRLCQPKRKGASLNRFDVAKLLGPSEDKNGECTVRGRFQKVVSDSVTVKKTWKASSALEEKWSPLKTSLVDAAKKNCGL